MPIFHKVALLAMMAAAGVLGSPRSAFAETLLLQDPALSKSSVAFVYAGDIWLCARDGGVARRLTSHEGFESSPRFSPDGARLAFSAQYEGNTDVYVVDLAGGAPRRLTWHPGRDRVLDWHPDGQAVLFASGREGGVPVDRLYEVDVTGGAPRQLAIPKAYQASWRSDARRLAYTPMADATRSWKRYRGGRTSPIWIYDLETHAVEEVPHERATDALPCWLGRDLYFVSDRDGRRNLWRMTPGGADSLSQLTRFEDYDLRTMSAGPDAMVLEQGGALHIYDPESGALTRLRIQVPHDGLGARARWQAVGTSARSASISPNGQRVVFEARGELLSIPREHGAPRRLTRSPGVHDRSPAWSPDGAKVAWYSDQGGEYMLRVGDQLGREPPRAYALGGGGFFYDLRWSPTGERIAFSDKTGRLGIVELGDGKVREVGRSISTLGVYRPNPTWSPDGRWLAYERGDPQTTYDRIALYRVEDGFRAELGDGFSAAGSPVFSSDGRYLFFAASTDSGPRRFGLDMRASASRRSSASLYVAVLDPRSVNPLLPRSDEGVGPGDSKGGADHGESEEGGSKGEEREPAKPSDTPDAKGSEEPRGERRDVLVVEGLDQRVLALPLPAASYSGLRSCGDALLYIVRDATGAVRLESFRFGDRKAKLVAKGVRAVEVAAAGKHLLLRESGGWFVTNEKGKDRKKLAIEAARVRVDPRAEWPQILREAWRLQRDYFYDQNMHGVDWPAMWQRWSSFLPHVAHRADLNLLIAEMIGELCCGHEYVSRGEMPAAPEGARVGLLGADVSVVGERYRLTRIYRGQNWNPSLRAPLTEPGVGARLGDAIMAVDGRPLEARENFFAAFEETAGRRVELTLLGPDQGAEPRTVTVVPVARDAGLRQLAWVESRRARVARLSGGRLGYVYLPDTGGRGMASFDRDFYSQLSKKGLVIDERYNRGGKVADYIIDVLSREVYCYWMTREKWLGRSPFATLRGPKVMVINERAGSGGDALPFMFRARGLGPLVGRRTWGGLVGISGYPILMDGGRVTAASFGVMDAAGRWAVENEGVAPDVEVVEWPAEVIAGADPQLDKAVALALEALEKPGAKAAPTPSYYPPSKR